MQYVHNYPEFLLSTDKQRKRYEILLKATPSFPITAKEIAKYSGHSVQDVYSWVSCMKKKNLIGTVPYGERNQVAYYLKAETNKVNHTNLTLHQKIEDKLMKIPTNKMEKEINEIGKNLAKLASKKEQKFVYTISEIDNGIEVKLNDRSISIVIGPNGKFHVSISN